MKILPLFASLLLPFGPLFASPIPLFPHLSTKGSAQKGVAPDTATITFTVLDFQAKSEDAVNNVNATLAGLGTELKKLGIKEEDITANDLEKSITRERGDNYKDLKILGYVIERKGSVEITDIKTYPEIAQLIFKTDLIKGVESKFDSSKKEEIELALFETACSNARKKAEVLAKAAGVTILRVYAVAPSDEDYYFFPNNRSYAMAGGILPSLDDTPDPPLFVPSIIFMESSVSMLFRLVE